MGAAVPWVEGVAGVMRTRLFVCDSVAWRLEPFLEALQRLRDRAKVLGCTGPVTVGYRTRDDLAVVAVNDTDDSDTVSLIDAAVLPGLRALHVPGDGAAVLEVRQRAFGSCEVVAEAADLERLRAELRAALGLGADARANLRVEVRLSLRYEEAGTWREGATRDLAAGGLFVETRTAPPPIGAHPRVEIVMPGELWPVAGELTVVRHSEGGFGARLALNDAEQQRLTRAVRRLRPEPVPDARRTSPRVPARYVVRFASGDALAQAYTSNISTGGVFVRTEHPPEADAAVRIALSLPDGVEFELKGRVVNVVPAGPTERRAAGFGVAFDSLSHEARDRLETHIAALLARPRLRALVVDEDDTFRATLRGSLSHRRCEVLEAPSATDAFRCLIDEILTLDVLVVGAHLPDPSALHFLERVRVVGGETALPVVIVADGVDDADGHFGHIGANAVLDRARGAELVADYVIELGEERRDRPL